MNHVYTCTMNPAIDLFVETNVLLPDTVNRTNDDDIQANGKGVNVSLILKRLGIDNTALGLSGGFTGRYIEEFLHTNHVATDFVSIDGFTRINVFTQVTSQQMEYKLVNKGPEIAKSAIEALMTKINQLHAGDYLCVSGSLPRGVPPEILIDISQMCKRNHVHLVLDSSYQEVRQCLKYHPFLIKPNEDELASWFNKSELTSDEYISYGKKLLHQGAQNVLISLGDQGCIYLNKDTCLFGNAPRGTVVNTACAGDTLLGTFMAGMIEGRAIEEVFKQSIAAGSSTAFRKGLTDFSDVATLANQINIRKEG